MEESEIKKDELEKHNVATLKKENINENETEIKSSSSEKKSKFGLVLIIIVILLIMIAIFSTIFAIINIGSNEIIKGVKINQIDVSGLTKDKAKEVIEEIYSKKSENEIVLKYDEFETTTTYKVLEVEYDIDAAIEGAYNIGRNGNIFIDNFDILKTMLNNKTVDIVATINSEMLNQIIQNINNGIEGAVTQTDYLQEDEKLIITVGKEGVKVEEQELIDKLYDVVQCGEEIQVITIPLINVQPDDIDIEEIHEEIYKEVKDAYYTKEPFSIYQEVIGVDFDVENAKQLLKEKKEKYEIPLIITKPAVTTKQIGTEAFPDLLATFATNYQASNVNRTTNLKLAANKINGTVLLPGEEFSYNKTVGERTAEAGFKNAAIYSNGKVVDGIGGGICQISTTLYDAVVKANLDVTVRRNHQFVTSYVGAGKDATVVWGAQDFKFKNTRKYPIRITSTVQGGVATVQIWGLKEDVEYDITIETKKVATIPYSTQYIQDVSLPAGQQKVVQLGNNGQKVEAYKVTKLNGQVVSRTLLSKDTYNAMNKIVNIGTGQ